MIDKGCALACSSKDSGLVAQELFSKASVSLGCLVSAKGTLYLPSTRQSPHKLSKSAKNLRGLRRTRCWRSSAGIGPRVGNTPTMAFFASGALRHLVRHGTHLSSFGLANVYLNNATLFEHNVAPPHESFPFLRPKTMLGILHHLIV
jgi:hypothetical protein